MSQGNLWLVHSQKSGVNKLKDVDVMPSESFVTPRKESSNIHVDERQQTIIIPNAEIIIRPKSAIQISYDRPMQKVQSAVKPKIPERSKSSVATSSRTSTKYSLKSKPDVEVKKSSFMYSPKVSRVPSEKLARRSSISTRSLVIKPKISEKVSEKFSKAKSENKKFLTTVDENESKESMTKLKTLRKHEIEEEISRRNSNISRLERRLSTDLSREEFEKLKAMLETEKSLLKSSIKLAILEQRKSRTEKWDSIAVNLDDH